MKTIALGRDSSGAVVNVELDEFELTSLVALVEQGQRMLGDGPSMTAMHEQMTATANEFRALLGHLELLTEE